MPALQPYLIEPIWERFWALLPEPETNHPLLGCHRPRVSDRAVFEKLVQVSVFGCAYERIADELCSATTLRRRRDEWIEVGPGRGFGGGSEEADADEPVQRAPDVADDLSRTVRRGGLCRVWW